MNLPRGGMSGTTSLIECAVGYPSLCQLPHPGDALRGQTQLGAPCWGHSPPRAEVSFKLRRKPRDTSQPT